MVLQRLGQAGKLLAVSHARPDGDGLGSIAALAASARATGKTAHALTPDGPPLRYDFLFPDQPCATAEQFETLADSCDLIVVADTCAFAQLDSLEEALRARREKVVVIDHHATSDDVAAAQWIDTSAAATGVMVQEVIEALAWPIDTFVATALLTAITTDTGWLKFANTDARCLRAAAKLLETPIRTDKLYRRLYQTDRPERLRLMQRMLETLELHCDGQLAVMTIRRGDFEITGARADETENLVNEALRLGSVEAAVILIENADCIRASLRSRDSVNVAEIASRFGGGGHRRSAGLRAKEDIDTLKGQLTTACAEAIEAADSLPQGRR